ncbi:hypothetical protein [Gordonia sp. (in: high G+C Gram-positive bacteria)]|uniref:hypothetical protein n=1 Tax=Gordonia sp. (in: high G+C Gram-positive bacteria) TaxID=84139 RepID=UPI0039E71108
MTARRRRSAAVAAAVLATGVLATACSVDGEPAESLVHRSVDPAAFPVGPGVEVTRVPPAQLPAIVGDVSGNPVGARIDPEDCAPQAISPVPSQTVVQSGFGADNGASTPPPAYTTVITRTGDSVDDLAAAVRRCDRYRRGSVVEVSVAQRALDGVPTVAGADVFGYSRTETSPGGDPVTTVLLIAQRRTIRVYATERITGPAPTGDRPDPALVTLFEAAAAAGLR